jgi:hypothetical protein
MPLPEQPPAKKTYHRPRLTVYGDVREITQTRGNAGPLDGGTVFLMNKSNS